MSSSLFASLNAGMLVRKGSAAPSLEAPITPPRLLRAVPAHTALGSTDAIARAPLTEKPDGAERVAAPRPHAPPTPLPIKTAPAPQRSEVEACNQASAPADAQGRPATRASARLSHDQMRALRLAALLLDRPQQELLASGLDLKMEALACGPLAECACFQAFSKKLASR